MIDRLIKIFLVCAIFQFSKVRADCCGKVDLGATYMELDVLNSGKTEETLHMTGIKGDATLQLYRGACLKTGFLYGNGQHEGELASVYVGLGHVTPLGYFTSCLEGLTLIPSIGVAFNYIKTHVDVEIPELMIKFEGLKETFRSVSPYLGLEFCYTFWKKWTLMGNYQYFWSYTKTKIGEFPTDRSHCCGPSYALGLEYSIDSHWAVNLGFGYNISLSKEKHGIRGKGVKLGLAYYF